MSYTYWFGPLHMAFSQSCVQVASMMLGTEVKHPLENCKHQIEMEGDRLPTKCWSKPKQTVVRQSCRHNTHNKFSEQTALNQIQQNVNGH